MSSEHNANEGWPWIVSFGIGLIICGVVGVTLMDHIGWPGAILGIIIGLSAAFVGFRVVWHRWPRHRRWLNRWLG